MIDNIPMPSWLRRLLPRHISPKGKLERTIRYSYDLAVHGANELRHDKAGQMAAALTYHTLFSLLPMLVLGMVVLNSLATEDARDRFIVYVVDKAIPQTGVNLTPMSGEDQEVVQRRAELMELRRNLGARIYDLMTNARENVHFSGVGLIGLLVFVYGATALLATTERSFNAIFGVPHQRPWYLRLPMYYTVITLGPVVLIAGQAVQAKMIDLIQGEYLTAWLAGPVAVISPIFATWLLLLLMYTMLPNTKVNKKAAMLSAAVGAVLWVISQELFGLYVKHAGVTNWYGAMALLPLFLMWLYYTWLVVLFGGELTYILQAMEGMTFKHLANKQADEKLLDPMWVVPVATRIAECFNDGKSVDPAVIAQSLNLPGRAIHDLLKALEKANIVHRVERARGATFALARPADRVTMHEVLDAVRQLLPQPPADAAGSPAWEFIQRLQATMAQTSSEMTLADLARKPNGQ